MKINSEKKVFVIFGATDMRLQAKGLSEIVKELTKSKKSKITQTNAVNSGSYFVFCGKTKKMIKILYWDRNGFCLWSKRLVDDFFPWPYDDDDLTPTVAKRIRSLLSGIEIMNGTTHIF